ncbi:MAG TPA: hypothetical protein VHW04_15900 [Solirubrobacteraceae bacterium]|nr:hypothetical protein [Solirubrobacteraceae bacterium]
MKRVLESVDNSSLTAVESFFTTLFTGDAAGGSWLPALLAATPFSDRLGELVQAPGWLQTQLAVPGASGRLACFEYPAAASKRLLAWYIDHPDRLVWSPGAGANVSAQTVRLRRVLIDDDPPGTRARAQERAHDLLARSSGLTPAWWRFEELKTLHCVLITERLVVTIQGEPGGGLPPATPWYPRRSQLVRNLEAARHLADGKRFATLVLSQRPLSDAADEHLERILPEAAPHLDELERRELHDAYLGNLTWDQACDAVGIPRGTLPDAEAARET